MENLVQFFCENSSLTHTQQQKFLCYSPQINTTKIGRTAIFGKCFSKVFNGKTFLQNEEKLFKGETLKEKSKSFF
jgi:hypothetical protein